MESPWLGACRTFCLVLALSSAVACAPETGILVSVSGAPVDVLDFYVAFEQGGRYVLDGRATGTRVDVSGRSLAVAPYELLLEPSKGVSVVRVLALGKRRNNQGTESLYSFAFTATPQRFIEEEVVRRAISLNTLSSSRWARTTGNCQRIALSADERYVLYPYDDLDCDGHGTQTQVPPDCADDDPEVFPTAFEYCDGKDTNCDGAFAADKVRCFDIDAATTCYAGLRACGEATGGGVSGECVLEGEPVAQAFCTAYRACGAADPLRCSRAVPVVDYQCTLKMKDALQSCDGPAVDLEQPAGADVCQWRVVQANGFLVDFLEPQTWVSSGESTELCKPKLRIKASGESPEAATVIVEFFADGNAGWVRRFAITQVDDPTCEGPALSCEAQ